MLSSITNSSGKHNIDKVQEPRVLASGRASKGSEFSNTGSMDICIVEKDLIKQIYVVALMPFSLEQQI